MDADMALLGLSEYEGRVYRALLAEHPATAYRLGRRSGVPLSRVYEIASRLVEKGAAVQLPGDPARYEPVAPDALVGAARSRAARRLDGLQADLSALFAGSEVAGHHWVRGEGSVLDAVAAAAAGAVSDVLAAAAPAAQNALSAALMAAPEGVRVRALDLRPMARGDSTFVVLVDGRFVLVGRLGPEADALSTTHAALVRLCADHFRLRSVADTAQGIPSPRRPLALPAGDRPAGWLDWEKEKQRRLLHVN